METFSIRPAQKTDIPSLAALDHSSTTDHVWQLEVRRDPRGPQISSTFREVRLPRPVRLQYPNDPAELAADWKNRSMIYVATAEAEPVGYLTLTQPRSRIAWIRDVVVSPRWRRRGLGEALLAEAHRWMGEAGCSRLFLQIQAKNYAGIMLAQKAGYEFCGYNDRYYVSQDVSVIFVQGV